MFSYKLLHLILEHPFVFHRESHISSEIEAHAPSMNPKHSIQQ